MRDRSEQERWLREDLAKNTKKCRLAMLNHPRWSSGAHGSNSGLTALYKVLYDRGVELRNLSTQGSRMTGARVTRLME